MGSLSPPELSRRCRLLPAFADFELRKKKIALPRSETIARARAILEHPGGTPETPGGARTTRRTALRLNASGAQGIVGWKGLTQDRLLRVETHVSKSKTRLPRTLGVSRHISQFPDELKRKLFYSGVLRAGE